jgi:hypothetical protein
MSGKDTRMTDTSPTTDTDPYTPLTDITWATLNYQLTRETYRADGGTIGWQETCDLAYELASRYPRVPIDGWRVLVDFLRVGHPITLEWATRTRRDDGGRLHYDVTRATGTVRYMNAPRPAPAYDAASVRFSYPGFGHSVRLADLRSISYPRTTYTFDVAEDN